MTKDLTQGSPVRLILGFALPLLAGMLFQQLYNLVDTLIVGRFLGMEALAGVGATGSINFLVLGFCMGVCSGFAIPVAQQFGAREESRMREFVANGTWLSIVFALVMTVLTVVYCGDILRVMNTPTDCFEQAYDYIVVIFAGIPFTFLYNLLSGWLRSLGDSKTPLFFLVLSSVLNVILDLAFILIFKLGVFDASLATVLSQAISGVLCLLFIMVKVPILHITRSEWRPQSKRMTELCAYGVPMGLQYSITAIGSVILQVAVNSLGSLSVAAVTAASKVLNFLACPFDALGSSIYCSRKNRTGSHTGICSYGNNYGDLWCAECRRKPLRPAEQGHLFCLADGLWLFAAGVRRRLVLRAFADGVVRLRRQQRAARRAGADVYDYKRACLPAADAGERCALYDSGHGLFDVRDSGRRDGDGGAQPCGHVSCARSGVFRRGAGQPAGMGRGGSLPCSGVFPLPPRADEPVAPSSRDGRERGIELNNFMWKMQKVCIFRIFCKKRVDISPDLMYNRLR